MSQSISYLQLDSITIRQQDGLFSLNDLHKASGGDENFKPAFFFRNDQAQALIAELAKGADLHLFVKTTKGRNGSTYACRELVIAYAAWISAAFHLKVIRVFLRTQGMGGEPRHDSMHKAASAINALKVADAVAQKVRDSIFQAALGGSLDLSDFSHYTLRISHNHKSNEIEPYIKKHEMGTLTGTIPELARRISAPGGLMVSKEELALLAEACIQRLAGVGQMKVSEIRGLYQHS